MKLDAVNEQILTWVPTGDHALLKHFVEQTKCKSAWHQILAYQVVALLVLQQHHLQGDAHDRVSPHISYATLNALQCSDVNVSCVLSHGRT